MGINAGSNIKTLKKAKHCNFKNYYDNFCRNKQIVKFVFLV
jgi:hypothetical protein